MAYINTVNPNNAPGAVTGAVNAGNVNSQYVFGNIQKPDFSDYITYRFPQYTITTLLNRIGRKSPVVGNDVFSWFEKGKFRNPYRDWETDRKSTRLNSSHLKLSRMPSSA